MTEVKTMHSNWFVAPAAFCSPPPPPPPPPLPLRPGAATTEAGACTAGVWAHCGPVSGSGASWGKGAKMICRPAGLVLTAGLTA